MNEPSQALWPPTASWDNLRIRAEFLAEVRQFFSERRVLEVETPSLCSATAGYPEIRCFVTEEIGMGRADRRLYLQSSPEAAMKRLIAAGSGPIYQICKAFRSGDHGAHHNPEFTILEYYRPHCNLDDLMAEVESFLRLVLSLPAAIRVTYEELFQRYVGLNPHTASHTELCGGIERLGLEQPRSSDASESMLLDMLFSRLVQPQLGLDGRPVFVRDFPVSQACLSRLSTGSPQTAERFEVYIDQIELANGCQELTEVHEQHQRFVHDMEVRKMLALPEVRNDDLLLASLESGMPCCSGVALGIDRLVMIKTGSRSIKEVVTFPWGRA